MNVLGVLYNMYTMKRLDQGHLHPLLHWAHKVQYSVCVSELNK